MKSQAFHLRTPEIRANCIGFISQLDDPDYVVTVKKAKESRSAAQHRLKWLWMGHLEKALTGTQHERTREDWNRFFKGKFMRGLLLEQDEEYHEFFTNADRLIESAPDENSRRWAKRLLVDSMKTEWLTVKNMSELMTMIDRYCQTKYSVFLPVPDDLGWAV